MSGFGRKGLEPGQESATVQGGFVQAIPARRLGGSATNDPIAAQRETFIAAERSRTGQMPRQSIEMSAPGVSDLARNYGQPSVRKNQHKSLIVAYVLWFCLGQLSAHRFYLGSIQSGIVQVAMFFFAIALLVAGPSGAIFGILIFVLWAAWIVVDVFRIPTLHRRAGRGDLSEASTLF